MGRRPALPADGGAAVKPGQKVTPTGILVAPSGIPEYEWLALRKTGIGGSDVGALLGMGAEYAFSSNWSGFIEYDYMDFQAKNVALPFNVIAAGAVINSSVVNKLSIAKVGINYKF